MDFYATLSLALVAGIVSFTSPCTLPLLPGYVSYISAVREPVGIPVATTVAAAPAAANRGRPPTAGPHADHTSEHLAERLVSRRRALGASALFILGFTAVFVALGATSSAFGFLLVRHLRALQIVGGALVIGMGIITSGLIRIPLLQRQKRRDLTRVRRGPVGAALLGASFAFSWTPCVGPVLASILATAAASTTAATGAVLLGAYSLGLGLPFLLVAAGVARGRQRLRWLRRHGRAVEITGGLVLIVMGVAMLTGGWTVLMSRLLALYARVGWPPL